MKNGTNSIESLELIDRKILFELDQNSRQSYAELGRKVRLGSDIVRYRVERMLKEDLIHSCSAVVDLHRLGMTIFKVYLRLRPIPDRTAALFDYLDRARRTYWLSQFYGHWNGLFSSAALDVDEFNQLLSRTLARFSDVIQDTEISTLVEVSRFPKKYLLKSASGASVIASGERRDSIELDELEYGILALLSADARMSGADLSRKLDTTVAIVEYRLKKMEANGVILGYRTQFNYSKLNLLLFKVRATVQSHDPLEARRFRDFCRKHPAITCHIVQVGGAPLEFEAEVSTKSEFGALMEEIEREFCSYVREWEQLLLRTDHYHRFAPNFRKLGEQTQS